MRPLNSNQIKNLLILVHFTSHYPTNARTMHDPFHKEATNLISIIDSSENIVTGMQNVITSNKKQESIRKIIENHTTSGKFFYGLEISSQSANNKATVLDFNNFKEKPSFTSIVWVGEKYINTEPIVEAPPIKCAEKLKKFTTVLPHITCYKMTGEKLKSILSLQFENLLMLRGDQVDNEQDFSHASDLIREVRTKYGDEVTIAAGGYPSGHPESQSKEDDINYLKKKVDSGVDFLITQISFSATEILEFIENCRKSGIKVPIIVGIFIPRNFRILKIMCKITSVCPEENDFKKYEELQDDEEAFNKYALQKAQDLITILRSNGVIGVHFFSLNYFKNVEQIVNEIF